MALPAPTVATDPAPAAETNAAFVTLNGYVTNAYTELVDGLLAVRDHVYLTDGSIQLIEDLTTELTTLSGSALPNPAVVADPATLAQTNAALATMTSYIDRLNTRSLNGTSRLREHLRKMGHLKALEALEAANAGIPTAALTAETVASDPVSLADMNAALADTTLFVDDANTDFVNVIAAYILIAKINPAQLHLSARLQNAVDALNAA